MTTRYECLQILASLVNPEMLVVTSLIARITTPWMKLSPAGANFIGLNLGICAPFAFGVSLAFPQRKVIALDGDGSLMVDGSSLITIADAGPTNLVIIIFDNQAYAMMGSTATARVADLEQLARASGIEHAATLYTAEDFRSSVATALTNPGPWFLVARIERETERGEISRNLEGRAMKDVFVRTVSGFPDYWRGRHPTPLPPA